MAFAEFADKVLFRHPDIIDGNATGTLYEPLKLFGFRISSDAADRKAFVIFLAIVFAILFFGLEMLRRTRWARRWIATADSPAASATIGLNLTWYEDRRVRDLRWHRRLRRCPLRPATAARSASTRSRCSPACRSCCCSPCRACATPAPAFMAVLGLASFPALLRADQPLAAADRDRAHRSRASPRSRWPSGRRARCSTPGATSPASCRGAKTPAPRRPRPSTKTARRRHPPGRDQRPRPRPAPFTPDKVAQLDRALHIADDVPVPHPAAARGDRPCRCCRQLTSSSASAACGRSARPYVNCEPGRVTGSDRSERRRQDDAVQRDHRSAPAELGQGASSTASTSPTRPRTAGPASASGARSRSSRRSPT